MIFELTILGNSSALPTSKRFPSAHVLNVHEHFFLIDCGEGTQIQLRRFKIKFRRLNHIFISHLHGDHLFGLFGLLSSFSLLQRKTPLYIHAPAGLEEILQFHTRYFDRDRPYPLHFMPFEAREPGLVHEGKRITVHRFPLDHRVPAAGFLFKEKQKPDHMRKEMIEEYNIPVKEIGPIKQGADFITPSGERVPHERLTYPASKPRSYVYCSDTRYNEKNLLFIEKANILYHEATFLEDSLDRAIQTGHSTALQAARLAREAGVGHLILGHFSARYKDLSLFHAEASREFAPVTLAEEGDKYRVKPEHLIEHVKYSKEDKL